MSVQKLRLQKGWSQEQLAEVSGLSVRTIQRIERGQSASVESMKALGAAFDLDFAAGDFSALGETDMATPMTTGTSAEEALAFAHVRRMKGFYMHLTQYCVVVSVLTVVNLATVSRHLWVIWVALGWGSGLLFHAVRVFDKVPFLNAEWERRQVERYLGRKL